MNIKFKPFYWDHGTDWARSGQFDIQILVFANPKEIGFNSSCDMARKASSHFYKELGDRNKKMQLPTIHELMKIAENAVKATIINEYFEVVDNNFSIEENI